MTDRHTDDLVREPVCFILHCIGPKNFCVEFVGILTDGATFLLV